MGPLGRILGPRGLINPKQVLYGCLQTVAEVKAGKIDFKVDKTGIMYMQELVFFGAEQIVDNAHEIIQTLIKLKPTAAKGVYQSIYLTSTMSPAITRPKSSIIGS
jgi:large subunit ribosomal protein L1